MTSMIRTFRLATADNRFQSPCKQRGWFQTLAVCGALVGSLVGFTTTFAEAQDPSSNGQEQDSPSDNVPAEKKPLDHDAYDSWNRVAGGSLTRDGRFLAYTLRPGDGDATAVIRPVEAGSVDGASASEAEHRILRGTNVQFTYDSAFAAYLIQPDPKDVRQARADRKPAEELPKNQLEILNLATGEKLTIERVSSYRLPLKAAGWIAYQLERPIPPPGENGRTAAGEGQSEAQTAPTGGRRGSARRGGGRRGARGQGRGGRGQRGGAQTGQPRQTRMTPRQPLVAPPPGGRTVEEKEKQTGTELVLRNLATGAEFHYQNVTSYLFSENGRRLAFAVSSEEAEEDGVYMVVVGAPQRQLISGRGNYQGLTFAKTGEQLAFMTDRADYQAAEPAWEIFSWQAGRADAELLVSNTNPAMPEKWGVAPGGVNFSESGGRLFFNTRPLPEPEEPEPAPPADGEEPEPDVVVDIWHWKDPVLQPQQLIEANRERNQTYQAMITLDDERRMLQLETQELENVTVGSRGDADVAIARDDKPYEMVNSWESPSFSDTYLVDLRTGEKTLVLAGLQGNASLSPKSQYAFWWDGQKQAWFALPTTANSAGERPISNLTELIPYPVVNELDDSPALPRGYGIAGWVGDDELVLFYDKHDIWAAQPGGLLPPSCVTDEYGRANNIRFRYQNLDPEERTIDPGKTLLLSAFHLKTKATGYFTDPVRGTAEPRQIIMRDEALRISSKAEDANVLLITRSTFRKSPNLWATDGNFSRMNQLTDANPQQDEYLWGTAEIHEWTSGEGEELQGILYKPDGFDPSKQYPLMVYFYERSSDGLHGYTVPAPGSSSINRSFYVSRGYVLFVPDIPYKIGHPGQSCYSAVVPGVTSLVNEGYIDSERIGVQGHSWGGYQIAYLVTKTNIFAAAEAGAPVSNMTSAYGGIRWSSGRSRMFQYERTQSRIGDTLWRSQQKFIENSPVFWADMVQTPLLMLHNDEDGAVPWYQGIEMFVALRRLQKPTWMFNYNGEDHGLRQRHNQKDWTIRMQQFFDHYLKDAPAPVWLADGVPGKDKGKTLGLDLIEEAAEDGADR